MTHLDEVQAFRAVWDAEAQNTLRLLEALPPDQYDFRPDPKGPFRQLHPDPRGPIRWMRALHTVIYLAAPNK